MTEGDRPADFVNPRVAPGADDDLGADASRIAEGDREERFLCGVGHAAEWRRVQGSGFRTGVTSIWRRLQEYRPLRPFSRGRSPQTRRERRGSMGVVVFDVFCKGQGRAVAVTVIPS